MSFSWKKKNLVNKGWVKIIFFKKKENYGLKVVVVSSEPLNINLRVSFSDLKKTEGLWLKKKMSMLQTSNMEN